MKRIISIIAAALCIVAMAFALAACLGSAGASTKASSSSAPVEVHVASLKGPTSIGLVDFMQKAETGETHNSYSFQIAGTADEIVPSLIQGKVDIALIPANAASIVYNKTQGAVQVLDINTGGVLYIVTADQSINSVSDLAGRTVIMTGKGASPEYVMNYLLSTAGIADSVTLDFKTEATEAASALASDPSAIAVLPQPYVTAVCAKNPSLSPRVSLADAWTQAVSNGSSLVTGVTVVRKEFAQEHPEAIEEFLASQSDSVKAANDDAAATGKLVAEKGIIDNATIAEKAIPKCNLVCTTGADMKTQLAGYLEVLFKADPSSIGGKLPGDDLYYGL
jgi:NitT/TauT family transport system substrate-binding protein